MQLQWTTVLGLFIGVLINNILPASDYIINIQVPLENEDSNEANYLDEHQGTIKTLCGSEQSSVKGERWSVEVHGALIYFIFLI